MGNGFLRIMELSISPKKSPYEQFGPWKKYIKGKNDSEVLFYWLLKHLQGSKNPPQAIRQAIRGIHRIWETCKKSYPIHPYPYHGLTWVLTNGKILLAFCYTDPRGFWEIQGDGVFATGISPIGTNFKDKWLKGQRDDRL